MILKASQRGGGMALAAHLLKSENEHVEVHEVRGFIADDLKGAMKEAQAVALGTRCKQHLFSVSLNPPEAESVGVAAFERAIERIEAANGLVGQPRIVVFHEKEGRRHAHAVWSRIDADKMTARPLPHFKLKLREVSKALYLEHGWRLPRGLADYRERKAANFTLAEWQQAKRIGRDPNLMKTLVRDCWVGSDTKEGFGRSLASRGLALAQGDRRDFVVVAHDGTVRAIPRLIGERVKQVEARLGEAQALPTVAQARQGLADTIAPRLKALIKEADRARVVALMPLHKRREAMKAQHVGERQRLDEGQQSRAVIEMKERAGRLRGGVIGVWDRLTGRHSRTVKQNEAEALTSLRRDLSQRDALVAGQLAERRDLQRDILAVRHRHVATVMELHRDLARETGRRPSQRTNLRGTFADAERGSSSATPPSKPRQILRGQSIKRGGPDLGR